MPANNRCSINARQGQAGWTGRQVASAAQVLMGGPALPCPASWMQLRTQHLGGGGWGGAGGRGWTTRGLRVFRLGKMKDASGNSSLGGRRGSAACLGACPEQPTLLFLSRADGDKLGKVKSRRLRGAFPERNSGSPASRSDLPTPPPPPAPQGPAVSCCPVLGGLFQIGS